MSNSFYPVLMSENIRSSADFFIDTFHFMETFANEWYISLINEDNFELAFIDSHHDTIAENYQKNHQGLILNFEVADVDQLYVEIVAKPNVTVLTAIRNEAYGQRHFLVAGPDGLLIDVIQVIPPGAEFSESYTEATPDHG